MVQPPCFYQFFELISIYWIMSGNSLSINYHIPKPFGGSGSGRAYLLRVVHIRSQAQLTRRFSYKMTWYHRDPFAPVFLSPLTKAAIRLSLRLGDESRVSCAAGLSPSHFFVISAATSQLLRPLATVAHITWDTKIWIPLANSLSTR